MTRPGDRLRALAARVCSARTMERLIDPVVADLQTEYAEAVRQHRVWKSRWARIAGYAAILQVIAVSAWETSAGTLHDWSADDRQALTRTIGFSVAAMLVVMLVLQVSQLVTTGGLRQGYSASRARLLFYLVPQALPVAVPAGLLFGILCGLTGRAVSRRSRAAVLSIALAGSAVSFSTLAWIAPAANQAFRVSIFGRDDIRKGTNELSVSELRQEIGSYRATPMAESRLVRNLQLIYHRRWALSCTTFVFALFALSVVPRRRVRRWIPFAAALAVCLGYYTVSWKARNLETAGALSPFIAAWLPNVVFALAAAALLAIATRRSRVTGGGVRSL